MAQGLVDIPAQGEMAAIPVIMEVLPLQAAEVQVVEREALYGVVVVLLLVVQELAEEALGLTEKVLQALEALLDVIHHTEEELVRGGLPAVPMTSQAQEQVEIMAAEAVVAVATEVRLVVVVYTFIALACPQQGKMAQSESCGRVALVLSQALT